MQVVKMDCNNKSAYEELLHRAKLPTLHTRRLQAIAILMYKVKNGLAPPHIADLFVGTNSQHHVRNHHFVIPRFRTVAYGKHSLTYLGPVIWSKLDIYIWSSESLDIFEKRIKLVNFTSLLDSTCKDCFFMSKLITDFTFHSVFIDYNIIFIDSQISNCS